MGSQTVDRGPSRDRRLESRLWVAAAGWLLLIYSTLYSVRAPIEFLRERNLLRFTVAAVFLLTAATVTFFLLRQRPGWRGVAILAFFGGLYLTAVSSVDSPEEKLHFIQYGVLGVLIHAALVSRWRARRDPPPAFFGGVVWPGVLAVLLTGALGWGDEGLQGLLPNRFYDLRDVVLNVVAAALAVSASVSWRWALAATRARHRAV